MHLPRLIAHRGASGYAPENTLVAMNKVKALGASWVEFDVQLSANGVPVVFHDDELERTTNGYGLVKDAELTELKKLDAGAWFSEEFAGETIPTLQELLTCLTANQLAMNLEIKPYAGCEVDTVGAILTTLQNNWSTTLPTPLLSSFNIECLLMLKKLGSPYPVAYLMHEWQPDWLHVAKELNNCISINVNQEILTAERVAEIKQAGYGLLSYTVNTDERAQVLFNWGVDGIFTDYVDRIAV